MQTKKQASNVAAIPALRVKQWIPLWDQYEFDRSSHRAKPEDHFYIMSMKASTLRALSGVNRRDRTLPGLALGIQRRHEQRRSQEIARYVKYGFPYSAMSEARRDQPESKRLRQPGWLPTAIVVNIVKPQDKYRGSSVASDDIVEIVEDSGACSLILPRSFKDNAWSPIARLPIEIIDGQHRLFAFNESSDDFEVPVVAFHGLDIGWQAYLFWTINIKPKKINSSLAFDLYPLLRTQDWLEEGEDYSIYRETRAQELTEKLWSYPKSAWHNKIDMTGDGGRQYVSQAAWVRSLIASMIKRWDGKGVSLGGIFGSKMTVDSDPLPWSRIQQAAFIVTFWNYLLGAVKLSRQGWSKSLRDSDDTATVRFKDRSGNQDAAFFGPHSLINQDQGVRVLLHLVNDFFFIQNEVLKLEEWVVDHDDDFLDDAALSAVITTFKETDASVFMDTLTKAIAKYDWRSSTAPNLTDEERQMRRLFRGSGGYAELRRQCVEFLKSASNAKVRRAAVEVGERMRPAR